MRHPSNRSRRRSEVVPVLQVRRSEEDRRGRLYFKLCNHFAGCVAGFNVLGKIDGLPKQGRYVWAQVLLTCLHWERTFKGPQDVEYPMTQKLLKQASQLIHRDGANRLRHIIFFVRYALVHTQQEDFLNSFNQLIPPAIAPLTFTAQSNYEKDAPLEFREASYQAKVLVEYCRAVTQHRPTPSTVDAWLSAAKDYLLMETHAWLATHPGHFPLGDGALDQVLMCAQVSQNFPLAYALLRIKLKRLPQLTRSELTQLAQDGPQAHPGTWTLVQALQSAPAVLQAMSTARVIQENMRVDLSFKQSEIYRMRGLKLIQCNLYRAYAAGHRAVFFALLKRQMPMLWHRGDTVLHLAIRQGDVEAVRALIEQTALPYVRCCEQRNILHAALMQADARIWGMLEDWIYEGRSVVDSLMNLGDSEGWRSALHYAMHYKCVAGAAWLLKCGADPAGSRSDEYSPRALFLKAIEKRGKTMTQWLVHEVRRGVRMSKMAQIWLLFEYHAGKLANYLMLVDQPTQLLHRAIAKGVPLPLIACLASLPEFLNAQESKAGFTPIHVAVQVRHVAALRYLLNRPTLDLSIKNHRGETAREYAASLGCSEMVSMLDEAAHVDRSNAVYADTADAVAPDWEQIWALYQTAMRVQHQPQLEVAQGAVPKSLESSSEQARVCFTELERTSADDIEADGAGEMAVTSRCLG